MEGGKGGQLDLTTPIKVWVLFSTSIYEKRVLSHESWIDIPHQGNFRHLLILSWGLPSRSTSGRLEWKSWQITSGGRICGSICPTRNTGSSRMTGSRWTSKIKKPAVNIYFQYQLISFWCMYFLIVIFGSLRSATNLAATAGDSPATKRSISTSEETDGVNGESGEPPVKRWDWRQMSFMGRNSCHLKSTPSHINCWVTYPQGCNWRRRGEGWRDWWSWVSGGWRACCRCWDCWGGLNIGAIWPNGELIGSKV